MFVSDILSQKGSQVFSVGREATVSVICRELAAHCIGSVVVQGDDKELIGIVSERDVVRAVAQFGAHALNLKVAEVMTDRVLTCDPDDTIDSVMSAMTHGRIRHLPVVRRGEVLGMVSIGDVVKARLDETRHETEALRAYIVTG